MRFDTDMLVRFRKYSNFEKKKDHKCHQMVSCHLSGHLRRMFDYLMRSQRLTISREIGQEDHCLNSANQNFPIDPVLMKLTQLMLIMYLL